MATDFVKTIIAMVSFKCRGTCTVIVIYGKTLFVKELHFFIEPFHQSDHCFSGLIQAYEQLSTWKTSSGGTA